MSHLHIISPPEGYVLDIVNRLKAEIPEDELRERFREEYAAEIDELYVGFLSDMALRKEIRAHPVLAMPVRDTELPHRIKKALYSGPRRIESVMRMVQHTPEELMRLPGIGPKAVETIRQYLVENGVDYR